MLAPSPATGFGGNFPNLVPMLRVGTPCGDASASLEVLRITPPRDREAVDLRYDAKHRNEVDRTPNTAGKPAG